MSSLVLDESEENTGMDSTHMGVGGGTETERGLTYEAV
jgi:hypothetical protein